QLQHRAMRGGVAIKGDAYRRSPLRLQRLAKECLGRLHIAVGAQAKVDSLAFSIDGTIEIGPLAADLHIGLVDAPRATGLASELIPALLELGHETLDPAH